ncbi:VanZ family protein [Sutcliffiella deserti]|uniref:VanZ family protein n=1 Tax=Sutcliffiella deserti TaxID=2875501 RepID=UPI001CBBFFAA|nr:VanZ family protein [Sutcliffiella deserti]
MKKLIVPLILTCFVFLFLTPLFPQLAANLHPIVLFVLFFCIFAFVLCIYLYIRKSHISMSSRLIAAGFVIYTLMLLTLLFFRPNEQQYDSFNLIPFATISLFLSGEIDWLVSFYNLAANIALFIPYGILLKWRTNAILLLVIVPILVISTIELSQYITNRGSLDIDDLLLNTLGFLIGYTLTPIFKQIIHPHK